MRRSIAPTRSEHTDENRSNRRPRGLALAYPEVMWTLIVILLVVWAILSIMGFVFEGLFWLGIIGIVLFAGTLLIGLIRQRSRDLKS